MMNLENITTKKDIFSYKKDGFGKVVNNELDLVKEIELNINNKFKLDKNYINKINEYFPIRDKNNNKRIYDEIIKKEK